jgi:MerR family transcriptional regulator/heat shock protein HspR
LEKKVEALEAENSRLREALESQVAQHGKAVEEVHRSYKREIMLLPRGEIARSSRRGKEGF